MITKKINKSAQRLNIVFLLLFGGAIFSVGLDGFFSLSPHSRELKASAAETLKEEVRAPADPFMNISLTARAVYVEDLVSKKVLFVRNENEKLPLASVTKLMTALVAREQMGESVVLTITKDDMTADGDSGLRVGERWRLEDILDAMLLISSNDAAHAVARFVGSQHENGSADTSRNDFVAIMNEKAHALGLTSMEFFNESGLDINETRNGGYGSAHDVARLMVELWHKYPETLEITARKDARIFSQDELAHVLPNTNEAIGHFPGLLASKTGYTSIAGGNLAMIVDRGVGSPVVLVVLGSGYKERFDDMEALVNATQKAFQ